MLDKIDELIAKISDVTINLNNQTEKSNCDQSRYISFREQQLEIREERLGRKNEEWNLVLLEDQPEVEKSTSFPPQFQIIKNDWPGYCSYHLSSKLRKREFMYIIEKSVQNQKGRGVAGEWKTTCNGTEFEIARFIWEQRTKYPKSWCLIDILV